VGAKRREHLAVVRGAAGSDTDIAVVRACQSVGHVAVFVCGVGLRHTDRYIDRFG
jgi:hypothetical protein